MMFTSFVPLAFLILAVLGAILFGLATPSEAAAIGALGGLLLAAAYRALTWQRLKESVYLTARTSAMVCWLFVGSATFASVFAYLGGQQFISDFVTGLDMSPLMFLIVAQLIIFILGWPLEWTEIIVIFIPIFLPLLPHFGIDPLFFGILVAVNLQTAFLSPPMAMSAYYLKGIAPAHVQTAGHLPRHDALYADRHPVHGADLYLSCRSSTGCPTSSTADGRRFEEKLHDPQTALRSPRLPVPGGLLRHPPLPRAAARSRRRRSDRAWRWPPMISGRS